MKTLIEITIQVLTAILFYGLLMPFHLPHEVLIFVHLALDCIVHKLVKPYM